MCFAGVRIESLNVANLFIINFDLLSFPVTILWIVAITNAVNLIDGLDGLAAGISAVVCAVFAVFAFEIGQPLMVVLMLALLGSLSGFLFYNFNPARIFMGDCGSMFLGFALASLAILAPAKVATALLVLGIPIIDVAWLIVRRWRQGSPTHAGRDHPAPGSEAKAARSRCRPAPSSSTCARYSPLPSTCPCWHRDGSRPCRPT